MSANADKQPYHHGNLGNALVEAAVELARQGGAGAIVLREAARQVGVSQTAAYRHFASLPDLANAVADVALDQLAGSMLDELSRIEPTGDRGQGAVADVLAVGRGYVSFALGEPGLFSAAFLNPKERQGLPADTADRNPAKLLADALDGLVTVGLLDQADRPAAAATAWAGVHGLALLLLGPMSAVPPEQRDAFIESCLELMVFGLVRRG